MQVARSARTLMSAAAGFMFLISSCAGSAPAELSSDSDLTALRDAMSEIEDTAYFADRVDWVAAAENAERTLLDTAESNGLEQALRVVLSTMRDPHAQLIVGDQISETSSTVDRIEVLSSEEDSVLVVVMPSAVTRTASEAWSAYIAGGHRALASTDFCGVILDLRHNSGGNVSAMIGAMGPLIGEGVSLRYVDATGEVVSSFGWEDRAVVSDSGMAVDAGSSGPNNVSDRPVVILIGRGTGSAAEGLLVAFSSRQNVFQLGEPTRGAPTGVAALRVSDSLELRFSDSAASNRDGIVYDASIQPDERTRTIAPLIYDRAREILRDEYQCS